MLPYPQTEDILRPEAENVEAFFYRKSDNTVELRFGRSIIQVSCRYYDLEIWLDDGKSSYDLARYFLEKEKHNCSTDQFPGIDIEKDRLSSLRWIAECLVKHKEIFIEEKWKAEYNKLFEPSPSYINRFLS